MHILEQKHMGLTLQCWTQVLVLYFAERTELVWADLDLKDLEEL